MVIDVYVLTNTILHILLSATMSRSYVCKKDYSDDRDLMDGNDFESIEWPNETEEYQINEQIKKGKQKQPHVVDPWFSHKLAAKCFAAVSVR